eukprot:scaffold168508_cov17-Cyclotella_meneghiniana.AAC.1
MIREKANSRVAWMEHMASIDTLYMKHHREDALLIGALDSTKINSEIRDVFREAEEFELPDPDELDSVTDDEEPYHNTNRLHVADEDEE